MLADPSSQPTGPVEVKHESNKRIKRPYHHHHQLQSPVVRELAEPAITDHATVDHLVTRSIGLSLQDEGFELADPVALDGFRNALEEYVMRFTTHVRQSMLASRRVQPIPQDFELAMSRHRLTPDDLSPYLKGSRTAKTTTPSSSGGTLLPSPPPEEDDFKTVAFLGPQLSGEDDRARSAYIPQHFPQFPSKHTYRHTPVFTEREMDPRRIRERATEDGRHGEEALRKLARAAFQDNQMRSTGRDKRLWGRRMESMDSMFEKTVKAVAKKSPKNNNNNTGVAGAAAHMEIDSGAGPDVDVKPSRSKAALNVVELPPVINCERDFWRRTTTQAKSRPEDNNSHHPKPEDKPNGTDPSTARVENWVTT